MGIWNSPETDENGEVIPSAAYPHIFFGDRDPIPPDQEDK